MCYTYPMVRNLPPLPLDIESDLWPALELIADKWAVIVIVALMGGTRRYGEVQRQVTGISQKMLTQTLRKLERDGLVRRTVYAVIPPKVEYALTPLGETLVDPLNAMCRWAEEYYPAVQATRSRSNDVADGEGEEQV